MNPGFLKLSEARKYPYASEFSLRAYYEENPEIRQEIQTNFREISEASEKKAFEVIDTSTLRDDINLHEMYREMLWAADGYMHNAMLQGDIDADKIEEDFDKLIELWKKVYQK